MIKYSFLFFLVLQLTVTCHAHSILHDGWDAKQSADLVIANLVNVTPSYVKGAHDADLLIVGERAFVVAEMNDVKAGESAKWPYYYVAMSIVDLKTLEVSKFIPFAQGGQRFEDETLPTGACFAPRLIQKNDEILRCFFASEEPGKRQAQTWYIDFNLQAMRFENSIHRAKLRTAVGTFDMQPKYFHADAVREGFTRRPVDYGLYLVDSFKALGGRTYAAINNYPGGQNGLAILNCDLDTFEVIGHYNEPSELKLTESSVNRLPDGTWMALCRQDGGNQNYIFTTSLDGKEWTRGVHRDFVSNGTSSKPTFDKFNGIYYLGWQEATQINGVYRSVFNLDVSRDGRTWERKYRFESEQSFQYPTFYEFDGAIWLSVTQGDSSKIRKERIMFGRLE